MLLKLMSYEWQISTVLQEAKEAISRQKFSGRFWFLFSLKFNNTLTS